MTEQTEAEKLMRVRELIADEQALEAHRLRAGESAALSVQAMRADAFVRIANLFLEEKLF